MEAVRVITGTAAPLDRADVDTDQIIPASWLKRVERTGFGIGLFSAWRENDPDFVLNRPEYAGASILIAGPNFGIGSSREHAVWALTDYGFRAVISPRFGDIFRNNATKSGLVPVVVSPEFAEALLRAVERDPKLEITIEGAERRISAPAVSLVPASAGCWSASQITDGRRHVERARLMPKIVLFPGDGVGPEVVAEAVKVLAAVEAPFGHRFEVEERAIGGDALDRFGVPLR